MTIPKTNKFAFIFMPYVSTVLDSLLQWLTADFQKNRWELNNKYPLLNQHFRLYFRNLQIQILNSTMVNALENQLSFSKIRCPTFIDLKTSLEVCFIFTKFLYFDAFNYESSPIRCFLCNNGSVGEINLVSCQMVVISYSIILFVDWSNFFLYFFLQRFACS